MENKIYRNSISPLFLASVLVVASFVPPQATSPKEKHPVDQGPVIVCSDPGPGYPDAVRVVAFSGYHRKGVPLEVSVDTQLSAGSPVTAPARDGGLTPFGNFVRTGLYGYGLVFGPGPVISLAKCLVAIPDEANLHRFFDKIPPGQLPTPGSSAQRLNAPLKGQIRFPNRSKSSFSVRRR